VVAFRDGRWMRLAPEPPLARAVTAVHAWATPSATPLERSIGGSCYSKELAPACGPQPSLNTARTRGDSAPVCYQLKDAGSIRGHADSEANFPSTSDWCATAGSS
jgi:hypothetical protein